MHIRPATKADVQAIYELIVELAVYEKEPDAVINTAEQLSIDLFDDPVCSAIVAEENGEVVGFALYYTAYSTWKGRCMYLEDFYVQQNHRRKGIGQALFQEVVNLAKASGVKRMDWQVLDWNELALAFYRNQNATLDGEWVNGRLFFD